MFPSPPSRASSLQTSALLAGDANLTMEERTRFCRDVLNYAGEPVDQGKRRLLGVGGDSPEEVDDHVARSLCAGGVASLDMGAFARLTRIRFGPDGASVHSGAALQVSFGFHVECGGKMASGSDPFVLRRLRKPR